MNYSFKSNIKQNKIHNSELSVHYFAFILNDNSLKENLKEKYIDKEITFVNESDFEKVSEKILTETRNNEKSFLIFTNSKKISKKLKICDTYFYFKIKNQKSTDIYYDEKTDLDNLEIWKQQSANILKAEDNFDIFKKVKKINKNLNKIIYVKNSEIQVAFKIMGVWRVKTDAEIQILLSKKNNSKIISNDISPLIFDDCKKEQAGLKIQDGILEYETLEYKKINFDEKLKWVTDDFFVSDITNESKNDFYKYEKFKIQNFSNDSLSFILNEVKANKNFSGIDFDLIEENNNTILKFEYGEIIINNTKNDEYVLFNFLSKNDEGGLISVYHYLKKNLVGVLETNKKSKFKKRELFNAIFGLAILVVLFYITFNFIFSTDKMNSSFSIMFGAATWKMPWIYIIIVLFMTNLFLPLINSIIIEKLVFKQEKLKFKRLWVYFIAAQLWSLGKFLTGNYFIAVFVWGWWLTKKLKVPGASIYSTFTSTAFIRAFMFMIIGGVFLIVGTTAFYTTYYTQGIYGTNIIISMSWVAYFFEWFSGMMMFLVLLSPTFQSGFSNILLKIKYFNKPTNMQFLEDSYKNIYIIQRDSIFKQLFKNKKLFYRYSILVLMPIIIDGIETVMFFNLVESSILTETNNIEYFNPTWNMISLTGIRLLANLVHMFPLLNLLPGGGIGFTELSLKILYEPIFIEHINSVPPGSFGDYTSSDIAEMTTFIQRFFNSYLKMSIVLILSLSTVAKELIMNKVVKNV